MFFGQFNFDEKTAKVMAAVSTVIGIIFILAANSVGSTAIRIATLIGLVILSINLKMTYHYIGTIQKTYTITGLILGILILFKPEFVMFILGIGMLIISAPTLYETIKHKDISDKVKIIFSVVTFIFAIFCIINSNAALVTIVRVIGCGFVVFGCYMFYEWLTINRDKTKYSSDEFQPLYDDYKFQNAEEIKEEKDE